jgi:hypothetical protein
MSRGSLLRRWAAACGALALLAGCGADPLPRPRPQEEAGAVPVVTDVQVERIRKELDVAVKAGDKASDPAPLQARLAGPALELRQARYTVRRALPDQPAPARLGGELLLEITPAAQEWPRFFLVVSRAGRDALPKLELLTQGAARDPYRLQAYVTLLPGVTLPTVSSDEPPEVLPPEEGSGLVAAPAQVVARYADALTFGTDSDFKDAFAQDAFRTQVLGEQDAERGAVGAFFAYQAGHAARPDAVWALRTEDGGAIVMGAMNATRSFSVTAPGAKLPLPADLAVLAGRPEATQAASVSALEIVAFAVPPEGSKTPITVLGGERGVLAATGS